MKPVWIVILTIVIAGGIVGGGTYYYLNQKADNEKNELQGQIDDLNTQIQTLQQSALSNQSDTGSISDSTNTTENWLTYTDTSFGFNIKYPAEFATSSVTSEPGHTIAFNPSERSFTSNLLALKWKLNIAEASTLENWIKTVSGTNQGSVKVGSYNGIKFVQSDGTVVVYWANSANNQVNGLYNYSSVLLSQKSITASQKSEYDNIFSTMLTTFSD